MGSVTIRARIRCQLCGKMFRPTNCRQQVHPRRACQSATCQYRPCGKSFKRRSARQRYCCDEHRIAAFYRRFRRKHGVGYDSTRER